MDINLPVDPPVNNNIQTTIYDRLDQVAFERSRVANSQLDTRLSIQEKILNKYRRDVERVHAHQTQRLRREVQKIREKKPDYVFDDSDVSTSRSRAAAEMGRKRCLSEPPPNLSYCRRFYSHHYNLKDNTRKDKEEKNDKGRQCNDYFNQAFRLYFLNMMNKRLTSGMDLENTLTNTHLDHVGPEDLGKSLDSSILGTSRTGNFVTRCETDRIFNAQSSVEESEDESVFEASHSSFKSNFESLKQKGSVDCLADIKETTADSEVEELERTLKQERKREGGGKKRRRSKVSDADIATYSSGLRKTKHAFEKLFAGLL